MTAAQSMTKRCVDVVLVLPLLVLAAPLLVLAGIWIRLDSPGPVLYRRRVLGRDAVPFEALKLRSMVDEAEGRLAQNPRLEREFAKRHKLTNDPRVTDAGRWLRRFSVDELPQLVNVLKGDMSLVGPRMLSPAEIEQYGESWSRVQTVRPGITGPWQVMGRAELGYRERAALDCGYVDEFSLGRDLKILFLLTPRAVIKGRGAY